MQRAQLLAFAALSLAMMPGANAQQQQPRAVVELFTSQGCSSCPPADRLAADLARNGAILVLSLPVDYWDYLGWKDTLANAAYSARQRAYAAQRGDRDIYTPQAVVNGSVHVLGSDRKAIETAIAQTQAKAMKVPVEAKASGDTMQVNIGAGDAGAGGEVWLCSIARNVPVVIGRGENSGATVNYINVARRWTKLGEWRGKPETFSLPMAQVAGAGVDAAFVMVQNGSPSAPRGPILGATLAALK